MFAKVIIDIKHEDVNRFFDYVVPAEFESDIAKGMRVVVPFGSQMRMGYVIELIEESLEATKEIQTILDVIPTINAETFHLINHLKEQNRTVYSAIFETVVPAEMGLDYFLNVELINKEVIDKEFLTLFNSQGVLSISKGNHSYDKLIRKYVRMNAVSITPAWKQKAQEKRLYLYTFNNHHAYDKASKYPILNELESRGYLKKELNELGLSDGQLKTLITHQVFIREKAQINREIKHVYTLKSRNITLTQAQQKAYDKFYETQHKYQTYLLKGITGSGKTELYLKWIADTLKNHKQVMVLVPEIALIGPMAERLESAFGEIAIYHSHLSKGERFDQYMKVKRGEINLVLGTRSASFLPLEKLGLIIMDEAHDTSYQQVDRVSYDTKDIAQTRAIYHRCKLILGSATPSISSMYQATNDVYGLLELKERPFGIKEPDIELVDMREELRQKNTSMFSRKLKQAIEDRITKGEQSIILFNRKGYAPFVMCRQCGHVPICPTCGISLTYYQSEDKLKCHYCGYEEPFNKTCSECHHPTMKAVGVGIEQVEDEIKKVFPTATILRMDANQTKTKGAHEIIWHDFKNQKADILLGTQMVAKGLDFPNVTLVGVLMADMMLRIPSYRASEDAFMLLMQVAGRSGRTSPGDVIIQGYDLDHYAIKDVLIGYDKFYEEALYERKISGYEPFNHVYQILCEGIGYLHTFQQAFTLKKKLSSLDYVTLGPVPDYIKKKGDKFRFIMTVKSENIDTSPIFKAIDEIKDNAINMRFYHIVDR